MIVVRTLSELSGRIQEFKKKGRSLGFVPTMGFLHDGHRELMRRARPESDVLVVSIFVNPTQFNDKEDFKKYPKNESGDLDICKNEKVDLVFLPESSEIYPEESTIQPVIRIPELMNKLCGATRPGHFEGVLLIITKLFLRVLPDRAYFGLKDYQQYILIKNYLASIGFPVDVIGVPTVREESGLAMSSRNSRLSNEELEDATLISRALNLAQKNIRTKNISISEAREIIRDILLSSPRIRIDYVEILGADHLEEVEDFHSDTLIAIAVFLGSVRLIDNIVMEKK
ncbi:MAG: pantoate--beta-alanine ligase [Leptospiraceae bacterium]|nr:pantoate--beta-alanine ligase [Leptospiraceae bacterium]MCP5513443.1 pantoate--beta-alanine ligase [Leptospiraceae bacterium]